jgi:hypothetical protein
MPAPTLKKSSPSCTPCSARCARALYKKRPAGTSRLGWEGREVHRNGVALVRLGLRHAPARAIGSCASPRRGSSSRPSRRPRQHNRSSAGLRLRAVGGPFPPAHEHRLRGRVRMARRRKNGNVRTILVGRTEARSGRPKSRGTDFGGAYASALVTSAIARFRHIRRGAVGARRTLTSQRARSWSLCSPRCWFARQTARPHIYQHIASAF